MGQANIEVEQITMYNFPLLMKQGSSLQNLQNLHRKLIVRSVNQNIYDLSDTKYSSYIMSGF